MAIVDERLVADLWERQAFLPDGLRTLGLRVVFRGVPSDAGGPDYQDALLSIGEREIVSGDIEFHVRSSDWYRHGHDCDQRYNHVVLHVVWTDDTPSTVRADGAAIPVLAIEAIASPPSALTTGTTRLLTHPCVSRFAALTTPELRRRISTLGERRALERAERLAAEASVLPADEVAYGALLEGMGYASNREVFRRLAEAVPFRWLRSLPAEMWADALLSAAGLVPPTVTDLPGRLRGEQWRLTRLRPANHPARRIQGVASLLARLGPHLADRLVAGVLESRRPSDLRALLTVRLDADALIGPGRADELAVSVVLPLALALEPESEAPLQLFRRYTSPPSTRWTRLMQDLLSQAGHDFRVRTAPEHQGLHALYHGYCRPERWTGCPVCASLRQQPSANH